MDVNVDKVNVEKAIADFEKSIEALDNFISTNCSLLLIKAMKIQQEPDEVKKVKARIREEIEEVFYPNFQKKAVFSELAVVIQYILKIVVKIIENTYNSPEGTPHAPEIRSPRPSSDSGSHRSESIHSERRPRKSPSGRAAMRRRVAKSASRSFPRTSTSRVRELDINPWASHERERTINRRFSDTPISKRRSRSVLREEVFSPFANRSDIPEPTYGSRFRAERIRTSRRATDERRDIVPIKAGQPNEVTTGSLRVEGQAIDIDPKKRGKDTTQYELKYGKIKRYDEEIGKKTHWDS